MPSAANSEPALKPNQPNHSRAAPSITNGRLCGFIGSLAKPFRLPMMIASMKPAIPALMCTTVPPAKSIGVDSHSAILPPPQSAPPPHTMCAIGA